MIETGDGLAAVRPTVSEIMVPRGSFHWQAQCSVAFEAEQLRSDACCVSIVRHVRVGEARSPGTIVWIKKFESHQHAASCRDWLMHNVDRCIYFARHASIFGPAETNAQIELGVQAELERREQERRQAARDAAKASAVAEQERLAFLRIESYLDDRDGWFGINLKWTCLRKVESFPKVKGELDDEATTVYKGIRGRGGPAGGDQRAHAA